LASGAGEFRAFTTKAYPEVRGPLEESLAIRRVQAEQSNTSIIYGSRLILKFIRRLESGINPELDMGRYLTEKAALPFVPPLVGGLTYRRPGTIPTTLALLHGYVRSGGNGWDYTLDLLGRYYEQVLGLPEAPIPQDMSVQGMLKLTESTVPEEALATVSTYLVAAEKLGQRTAELHCALAQDPSDAAFAPEPMTVAHLTMLAADLESQAQRALEVLTPRADGLAEPWRALAHQILAQRVALIERLHAVATITPGVARIRCHGDYHLGQLLWCENNFIILDFEGEPARPLAERRRKHSPLKDVAGMLRSFSYAAYAALHTFTQARPEDYGRLEPWAVFWQHWTAISFLRSYLTTAAGSVFLPPQCRDLAILLEAFMVDKALYELLYELNNRPHWLQIPLRGVQWLLEAPLPS
jgi:maltose alpha-D-glucosyltransferase/alpha-amylase